MAKQNYKDEQLEKQKDFFRTTKPKCKFEGEGAKPFLENRRDNFAPQIKYEDVIGYFKANNINWWRGNEPTNHVLSSQIACINHLFPIRKSREAVLALAQAIDPEIDGVEILENDKNDTQGYISFEVVSNTDHLNERKNANTKLTRGSQCTSLDAVILAKKSDKKILLAIEWKYVENYYNIDKSKDSSGQTRLNSYTGSENVHNPKLIQNSKQLEKKGNYKGSVYFFEPFYQLMRQTLWAEQMVKNQDKETIKADDYINVHIIPKDNAELRDRKYKCNNGKDLRTTWTEQLCYKEKYVLISPDELFEKMTGEPDGLKDYLKERYWK